MNQSISEPVIILQWVKTMPEHAVMMADLRTASIDRGASEALCSSCLLIAPPEWVLARCKLNFLCYADDLQIYLQFAPNDLHAANTLSLCPRQVNINLWFSKTILPEWSSNWACNTWFLWRAQCCIQCHFFVFFIIFTARILEFLKKNDCAVEASLVCGSIS